MSGRYPFTIELVWRVLQRFAHDWELEPDRWERERDIQMALASRLDAAMRVIGEDVVVGTYAKKHRMSRVCCEPRLYFAKKKLKYCFPDIVLWDELKPPYDPPDWDAAWRANWPVLWACEIKVNDRDTGPSSDEEKLVSLVGSGDVAYGCVLDIRRKKGVTKWTAKLAKGQLWRVDLRLPSAGD